MRTQTSQKAELFARALRTTVLGVFAVFTCALLLLLLSPTQTDAATSGTVNFQARLETASGGIVPDGNYNVEFKLFNAVTSSGSSQGSCTGDSNCLWTETRTGANQVRVANGYLTANLGSVTAFSGSMNWNQQLWLSMNIGGTGGSPTWDGEMSPRLLLTATPYAFQAGALGTTQGANVSTLSFATQTGSHAILLPDAAGTVCLQSSASCGFLTGSGSAFLQGGNSFGAQAVLGTNDNNSLAFRTNSSNRLVLDTSGNLQFQQASTINVSSAATGAALTIQGGAATSGNNVGGNLVLQGGAGAGTGASGSVIVKSNANNSTTAFQVQNGSSSALLTADTANLRLGVDVTYALMTVPSSLAAGAASGGSLGVGTYKYEVTAIDSAGGETTVSNEASGTTTSSNKTLSLTWTGSTGASAYKIYRTALSGASGTEKYLTTVLTNSYSDSGIVTLGTATPPSSNNAYVSTNVSNNNLQLSLGGNGTPTAQLYVSGTVASTTLAALPITNNPLAVYVQGRYAYVMSYNTGLFIYDVSNPAAPTKVGNISTGNISSACVNNSLYVQGRYAYATNCGTNTLNVVDISNPSSPVTVSSVGTGTSPFGVYVQGHYAYVVNNSSNTLGVYDITNPTKPVSIASVSTGASSGPISVYVQGRYAYVTNNSNNTLGIFDVSTPAAPTNVTNFSTGASSGPISVYVQGRYAYVVDSGDNALNIYDISNPSSPVTAGSVSGIGFVPTQVYVQGRYAYVSYSASNFVGIYDVSNPATPFSLGSMAMTGNGHSVYVQGRYVYAVDSNNSFFDIFDVGGAYIQQLQVGGIEASTLQTDSNATINGDAVIGGGLTVGQSTQINGDLGVSGAVLLQNQANSTNAFQVQDSSGNSLLGVDTSNTKVSINSAQNGSLTTFTTNTNALPVGRNTAPVVSANGYVYVLGGADSGSGGGPNSTVFFAPVNADGSVGSWKCQGANSTVCGGAPVNSNTLPATIRAGGAAAANGYIYYLGGAGDAATVYYAKLNADGTTGTWRTNANALPLGHGGAPVVKAANGYIYFIGGTNSGVNSGNGDSEVYYAKLNADGSVGAWTTSGNTLPDGRYSSLGGVANGYIYVVGGFNGGGFTTATVLFAPLNTDGSIGSWKCDGSSSSGECNMTPTNSNAVPVDLAGAGGGVMNGYLYLVGGINSGGSDTTTVYYAKLNADGSNSAFATNGQSLPAVRENAYSALVNGYIYSIGGSAAGFAGTPVTTVYYTSGPRLSVAADLDLVGTTSAGAISSASSAGGNIYAGSIFSNGNLSVQGGAQIRSGLSVAGEFNAGGGALFQDATNSTTAFQIQNASAANLFVADTSDGEVGIGSLTTLPTTNTKLLVVSNVSAPTFAASANGVGIDLSAGGGLYVKDNSDGTEAKFEAFGSELGLGTLSNSPVGFWTNNGEKLKLDTSGNIQFQQASTINIASATTGRVLTIQGGAATSGTNVGGNLLLQGGAGASTGASGSVIVKSNTNNSTAAFAVQNASGNGVLTVDTSGAQVLLGKASTINGVLVFDNSTNGNTVTLQSGVTSASYALTLPTAVGSSGDCLKATNGTGTLGWGSCGGGSFVTLQGSTPGTADTGNFNITGTGIAGILQAGTLKLTGTGGQTFTTPLGNSKGTQINIPLYDPGAFTGVLTLGIPSSAVATSRVIQVYDGRSTASEPAIAVASPDENEVYGLGWNGTNNTAYLETTGSDSAPTIALSSNATTVASFGTGVATIYEGLTLSGTGQVSYVTPQGTSINTKVNIPNFNPGNFSQIQAMGLPSTAPTSARVITFFDQRASTHQPSIDLFSPDENQYGGLSWDGANTTLYFKSSQGIALSTGDANTNTHNAIAIDTAQATSFTPGNTTGDSLGLSNSTLSGGGANLAHLTFKNNNSGAGNTINGMQIDEQAAATPSSGTNTSNLLHLGGNAGGTVNGVDFYTGMTNGIKFDGGLSFTNYISSDNFTVTGGGAMTALGNALVKATSSTAFVVQNAGGTALLTADTSGTQVVVGSTSNGVVMSSTGFSLAGTARGTNTIYLNAEYAGAVLDAGSGSNNTGTMTSGIDLTNRMNYYKWTTTQATNQNYDVDVQVPLPANFSTWASNPLSITTYTSDTTNGTITLEARDSGGTVICNFVAVTPGSTTTWTTNNTACTLGTGTYTAGNYITLRIRLQSPQNGDVRVGNISLNYLANR